MGHLFLPILRQWMRRPVGITHSSPTGAAGGLSTHCVSDVIVCKVNSANPSSIPSASCAFSQAHHLPQGHRSHPLSCRLLWMKVKWRSRHAERSGREQKQNKKKKTWVRMMEPPHNIPSPESQELVLPHPREKSVFKVGGGLKDI